MPYLCDDTAECHFLRDALLPPTLVQLLRQYVPPATCTRHRDAPQPRQSQRTDAEAGLSECGTLLLRLLHDTSAESEAWLHHFLTRTTSTSKTAEVCDGNEYARAQSAHDALWFLLVYYSEDASSCLAYAHGLMRHLIALKHRAPPPPTQAGHTANPSSSHTRRNDQQGAEARRMCECCCPCGCVRRGVVVDRARYRFHKAYYSDHHTTGGASAKINEEATEGGATMGEGLQADNVADTQLLPLPVLALQTLANFVLAICGKYYRPRASDITSGTANSNDDDNDDNDDNDEDDESSTQPRRLMTYEVFFTPAQRAVVVLACTLLAWKQLDGNGAAHMLVPSTPSVHTRHRHRHHHYRRTASQDVLYEDSYDDDDERHAGETFWSGRGGALEALACLFYATHTQSTASTGSNDDEACEQAASTGHVRHQGMPTALYAQPAYQVADICVMESFVFRTLGGQVAQLPLWWRVAMEVMQLYYSEALLDGVETYYEDKKKKTEQQEEGEGENEEATTQCDDDDDDNNAQRRIAYGSRVTSVRLAFRAHLEQLALRCMDLLLLPALLLDAEAVRPQAHTRAAQQQQEEEEEEESSNHGTPPMDGNANALLETLYAYMGHHPLLGAALAIEAGAVPFSFLSAMFFVLPSASASLRTKTAGTGDACEATKAIPELGAAVLHGLLAELTRWRQAGQTAMATLERSAQLAAQANM